jgi:uncharacterized protein YdhG (YjbR/CyaY superfamily)
MSIPIKDTDAYLALQPEDFRTALEKLRDQIRSVAPDAEEVISYQVPAFKYNGMLVSFGAAKAHCAFYVMSSTALEAFEEELKDFKTSKGTIRFTPEKPIPATLVKKIVKARIRENTALKEQKETTKTR